VLPTLNLFPQYDLLGGKSTFGDKGSEFNGAVPKRLRATGGVGHEIPPVSIPFVSRAFRPLRHKSRITRSYRYVNSQLCVVGSTGVGQKVPGSKNSQPRCLMCF
jgi:hypothetical protein